ncbi:hypothetical protein LCGC14_1731750 [marine sediment metagenome]|uniref:Uncharacterized protein n=1 Tax=marine sediment metagenome TaxID=412755 RepID=A0A0F9H9B3_9ZZZZ
MDEKENVEIKDYSKDKVYIDLEGKSGSEEYEKALIPEDAYNGTIVSVGLQEMKAYKAEGTVKKLLVSILIDDQKDKEGNEIVLPLFVKPTITKAYGPSVSNSKLYDILEKADLLGEVGKMSGELEMLDALRAFLESRFQGKSVRVEVKTTNKNNPDKASYSSVRSILRFESVKEVSSE